MRRDSPAGLLLIDAEPAQAGLISALAQRAGWRVLRAADVDQAIEQAGRSDMRLDAALIDLWSPDEESVRAVALLKRRRPDLPIIVVTAQDSVDLAVRAMRAGARDVVIKPIASHRLLAALDNAAAGDKATTELSPLAEKWSQALDFSEMVGSAPAFCRAIDIAMRASATPATILIEGESGVGKEVLAQAIHHASDRSAGPLVTVNCAAIPANLVESELFGHERGAFTGAFERRLGLFATADGGTIFLDEIGDLPSDAQAKLLRVLQSGEIRPITLPPLRARSEDVGALAEHLLERIAAQLGLRAPAIDPSALALLEAYDWPGNVRQLHNVLFRAAIFARGSRLTAADFPQIAQARSTAQDAANDDAPVAAAAAHLDGSFPLFGPDGHVRPIEDIEADLIRLAIGHYRGRMTEVARRLRIGRSTLYRKLGELGIEQVG
jgi:DNA-binding NtrC family response regulator